MKLKKVCDLVDNAPGSVSHVAADAAVVAAVDPGRVSASSGSEMVIWKYWSL